MLATRGVPPALRAENVPRERFSTMRNGAHMVTKYEDRTTVHLYSTCYSASMVQKVRYLRGGQEHHTRKPVVAEYNMLMGGVDKADQYQKPYLPQRK